MAAQVTNGYPQNSRYLSSAGLTSGLLSSRPLQDSPDASKWMGSEDEPPTPPPKGPLAFGFPHKPSFASFSTQRPSSSRRTNESFDEDASSAGGSYYSPEPRQNLRKQKSGLFAKVKRSLSKPRLDVEYREEPITKSMPPLPSTMDQDSSFLSLDPSSSRNTLKKDKSREKKKTKPLPATRSAPPTEPEIMLDTNLDQMDGIIHPSALVRPSASPPATGSEGSITASLVSRGSSHSIQPQTTSPPVPLFRDPFLSSNSPARKTYQNDQRKISPRTVPPVAAPAAPAVVPHQLVSPNNANNDEQSMWDPPESWAVDKEGGPLREPDYSSSEESTAVAKPASDISTSGGRDVKRKSRRRTTTTRPLKEQQTDSKTYKLRVYRANNNFHVVSIGPAVSVSELMPYLNVTLLFEAEREVHRLYIKERGRERLLAHNERPADIARRRLEQAGYDDTDRLELLLGEDLSFLLKFVYKSNVLGPAEEDLIFTDYRYVDLTNKSLRTIPIVLYGHAEDILSLNLSRNPMLEIPLDFVQSCVSLRELRLSNMSIKKVPQSVRHCTSLYGLDLSCNRIGDLDDVGLDRIPDLTNLMVQNNRMEKLPWYFPRLRNLRTLNISNNKFHVFPDIVCRMTGLKELDISFNMISELPEEIAQLTQLERLIIVGNQVSSFPRGCRELVGLRELDCRRNNIIDLTIVQMLPKLENLYVNHNAVHALDLSSGPCVAKIDVSHNDITQISLVPGPIGQVPHNLTYLNISHAKLSSLADLALASLSSLESLILDCNNFRFIPDSLGELTRLISLSCSDNALDALPASIGRLQKLEILDVHNNNLTEIPASLWNCASLTRINMTSNLITTWHPPSPPNAQLQPQLLACTISPDPSFSSLTTLAVPERKISIASSLNTATTINGNNSASIASPRHLPPLVYSLERLYLGENQLADEALPLLTLLRELRVLNLSFNEIQELPSAFFRELTRLEELYVSGNKLSSLPTEDLNRLIKLQVLYLNGNRLQTLPQELGKLPSLAVLDVGSNVLKYNINNWEFDWNWNFNQNLRYLNLSGNKRLEIKPDQTHKGGDNDKPKMIDLAGFSALTQLRVLGLMDVTTTFAPNIPDDNEDRRVRTSLSEVNRMAYGIADNLGNRDHVCMFDLVQPSFRDRKDEAIFAMFGRSQPSANNNRISKYLHDNFMPIFSAHLASMSTNKELCVPDALRRTFLKLNRLTHDYLFSGNIPARKNSQTSHRSAALLNIQDTSNLGASGIVLYIQGKTLYAANVGNALAVVSRRGTAQIVAKKHDPFDRNEIARIRAAEGWVSPKGLVNDEVDISRSFGFYHLLPVVNARPDIYTYQLSELDEFIIVANSGLWDYVSYQTAVDIARSERADPMIAAQKLRDFAISYGAEGSTMVMVISTVDIDSEAYQATRRKRGKDDIADVTIARLDGEVPPPVGHLALVFTDIRNSTHLWETNAGMPTAMRLHHSLLRRQLRFCGGYEVKTEGDAFMVAFQTVSAALMWCLDVQVQLLNEAWPQEILDCEDGRPIRDEQGKLVARGLSVRMGVHCGTPVCEPDAITKRMDYFGPMVNRASRVCGSAEGGELMLSADVVREFRAHFEEGAPETEYSSSQPADAIDAIRRLDPVLMPVGEVKLKGLEVPEMLSRVFPHELIGRVGLDAEPPIAPPSEVDSGPATLRCSAEQLRELSLICIRLEALTSYRVFKPLPPRKGSLAPDAGRDEQAASSPYMYGDPAALLPTIPEKPSEAEVLFILDFLLIRLETAVATLAARMTPSHEEVELLQALHRRNGRPLDAQTLSHILELLGS